MARRIEQISPLSRVQIEEDTRHNNNLLMQTCLEEVQPIINLIRQIRQIKPKVESAIRLERKLEAHTLKAVDDIVALLAEVALQSLHLFAHAVRLEHRDGGLLEGHVAATIEVRAARANGLDELLGSQDPRDTPAGKAEALGKTVDDDHVVVVYVDDVVGGGDDGAVTAGGVVVTLLFVATRLVRVHG